MSSTNLQDAQNTGEDDSVRRLRERSVSEKDARDVAEASRITDEQRPSFAKGIYMGDFDLSLIRPHPPLPPAEVERSEKFLADLTEYCAALDSSLNEPASFRMSTWRDWPSWVSSGSRSRESTAAWAFHCCTTGAP